MGRGRDVLGKAGNPESVSLVLRPGVVDGKREVK